MASNVDGNIGKVPESTVVLEKMKALEKLMQAVSVETKEFKNHYEQALEKVYERINKENQRKFDQLSDRLQSIETSIGKISKSIEDAQKSNDVSEKKPIEEPRVSTNDTTNLTSESSDAKKLPKKNWFTWRRHN